MDINEFLEHKEEDTPRIALLKEFYAGKAVNTVMGTLDMAVVSGMFVESPVWHVCPGFPGGGTYRGVDEVFGSLYAVNIPKHFSVFYGVPEVFIDGGDVVTVLGYYNFAVNKGDPVTRARFSHTFKFVPDGRIEGVWQVADSHVMQECLRGK